MKPELEAFAGRRPVSSEGAGRGPAVEPRPAVLRRSALNAPRSTPSRTPPASQGLARGYSQQGCTLAGCMSSIAGPAQAWSVQWERVTRTCSMCLSQSQAWSKPCRVESPLPSRRWVQTSLMFRREVC